MSENVVPTVVFHNDDDIDLMQVERLIEKYLNVVQVF